MSDRMAGSPHEYPKKSPAGTENDGSFAPSQNTLRVTPRSFPANALAGDSRMPRMRPPRLVSNTFTGLPGSSLEVDFELRVEVRWGTVHLGMSAPVALSSAMADAS